MPQVKDAFGEETIKKPKKKKVIPKIKPTSPVKATPKEDVVVAVATPKKFGTYEEGVESRRRQKAEADAQAKDTIVEEVVPTPKATVAPTETIEDIINRIRREKEVANALARETAINQGTTQLQGNLDRTQAQLNQQQEGLDPRYGSAKASAVAGTRVAQNRLAGFTPFSGQQSGRTLRQAQGIESDLQGRQSELDEQRQTEEQGIAFNRQQAIDQFNTGLTSLQQGATLAEIQANAQAADIASARLFDNAQTQANYETEKAALAESREYNEYLTKVENATDREVALFEQQLLERNKQLDYEIREAEETSDFARLQTLTTQKATNDLQLEGVKQANRSALESQKQAGRELLAGETDIPTDTYKPNISTVNASLNNALGDTEGLSDEKIKDRTLEWIVGKSDVFMNDPDLLMNVLTRNNISPEELEEYETWRDRALNSQ